jgi:hypothetical protein
LSLPDDERVLKSVLEANPIACNITTHSLIENDFVQKKSDVLRRVVADSDEMAIDVGSTTTTTTTTTTTSQRIEVACATESSGELGSGNRRVEAVRALLNELGLSNGADRGETPTTPSTTTTTTTTAAAAAAAASGARSAAVALVRGWLAVDGIGMHDDGVATPPAAAVARAFDDRLDSDDALLLAKLLVLCMQQSRNSHKYRLIFYHIMTNRPVCC